MNISIGQQVIVIDDVLGTIVGKVTKFHRDGSPMASFNGYPAVVLHEGTYTTVADKRGEYNDA